MKLNTEFPKWEKGEFKIATNPNVKYLKDQPDTRKGYTLAKVFGIDKTTRTVTHLPTGFKLPGYFRLLRDAKAYAEALLPLTDWQSLTADNATQHFTPIKAQLLRIVRQYAI